MFTRDQVGSVYKQLCNDCAKDGVSGKCICT